MNDKEYRYFDTGDKAVDKILDQLDHMSAPYETDNPRVVDDWIIGFLERWRALPREFRFVIRNNAQIGDLHFKMSKSWLEEKFSQIRAQLDEDIEKILADEKLAGRSNTYFHGSKRDPKYGDRSEKKIDPIHRDFETSGEIVDRLCGELVAFDSLFYESRERNELLRQLRSSAQGHLDILHEVSKLEKLLSKKRIPDLDKARSDAIGMLYRMRGHARNWHRRPSY